MNQRGRCIRGNHHCPEPLSLSFLYTMDRPPSHEQYQCPRTRIAQSSKNEICIRQGEQSIKIAEDRTRTAFDLGYSPLFSSLSLSLPLSIPSAHNRVSVSVAAPGLPRLYACAAYPPAAQVWKEYGKASSHGRLRCTVCTSKLNPSSRVCIIVEREATATSANPACTVCICAYARRKGFLSK